MNLDNLTPEIFSHIENPMTQQQFLNDLQSFITDHPYFQICQGTLTENQHQDQTQINMSDPDGDYEEVNITIKLIP